MDSKSGGGVDATDTIIGTLARDWSFPRRDNDALRS